MEKFNVYKDIKARTNGDIYIGVVGPVRTGKSTFIKRFADLMVIPEIEDENVRMRTRDELPQSAAGKTIMTTEPKFIPKEAIRVNLEEGTDVSIRLIDCVGYMVDGAAGHIEENGERMVKTPWYEYEIPFTQAAEIGTQKVIEDHSTIGIVVTCDGSFGELQRDSYLEAEEKTITELKRLGKPFVVLLNSQKPYSDSCRKLAKELEEKYQVTVVCINCEQMRKDDIKGLLESVLDEFPIRRIEFYIPKWVEMLDDTHEMKKDLIKNISEYMDRTTKIKNIRTCEYESDSIYIKKMDREVLDMSDGTAKIRVLFDPSYYYQILSELSGTKIEGEYQLITTIKELTGMKQEYQQVQDALQSVRMKGYGVVLPKRSEIQLDEPMVIRQGNKYGVKIRTEAPSIHMIRANIETEIAPIVGSEEQAKDLIDYIKEGQKSKDGIWETNIFGKSVEQLVEEGIHNKLVQIGDESQGKLQDTMQKVVNDSSGGMVCIII